MKLLAIVPAALLLTACQSAFVCPPDNSQLADNAGCAIFHENRLLVVQQRSNNRWSTPGGTWEAGESAQCTAARETFEETGLRVKTGDLITRFDNGFYLFRCDLQAGQYQDQISVPVKGLLEVKAIRWRDPASISAEEWRYPARWEPLKQQLEGIDK